MRPDGASAPADPQRDPHRAPRLLRGGRPLAEADTVLLLLHGRGGTPEGMLPLAEALGAAELGRGGAAVLAPAARGNSWYPHSFMAPLAHNQPALDSALAMLEALLEDVEAAGVASERVVLVGFSQGACLASEFVARRPRRYGALLAFSGGLIGPPGAPLGGFDPDRAPERSRPPGDPAPDDPATGEAAVRPASGGLAGTPVFLGCSDRDPHIPEERVRESAEALARLGGAVTTRIYPDMAHTIVADEIEQARFLLAPLRTDDR